MRKSIYRRVHKGFTLFEVLAALGLSAMVMMMVGSVLHLHLRMTDTRRVNVENAQLARSVLRYITRDLRSAVYVDAETIESSQVAAVAATDEGVSDGTDGNAAMDDSVTASEQTDPAALSVPGLYGGADQLRVDVHRTNAIGDGATTTNAAAYGPLGSLQTISYYLDGSQAGAAVGGNSLNTRSMGSSTSSDVGLFRQVIDQPVASWAVASGGVADLGVFAEHLAPEVASLTFNYYDGTQWLETWDSYQQGGLPVAVEVTIVISPPQDNTALEIDDSVYTTVIHLPTALPTDETEALF